MTTARAAVRRWFTPSGFLPRMGFAHSSEGRQYEDKNHAPKCDSMTPQQALKAIMKANGLSQAQIGTIIGSESAVSMFLKGERELSKSHIKALTARFRVDAGIFL